MRKAYLRTISLFIVSAAFTSGIFAQRAALEIDSLKHALSGAKTDTGKLKLMTAVADKIGCSDTAARWSYINDAQKLAEKTGWVEGAALANISAGLYFMDCHENDRYSLHYLHIADSLTSISGDKIQQARALHFLANGYASKSDYSNALSDYGKALALNSDPKFTTGVLGDIGNIYSNVGDYPRALTYYDSSLRALDENIRLNKEGTVRDTLQRAALLMTIANIYVTMAQYDNALANYNNALQLIEQTKRKAGTYMALTGIGETYMYKKDPTKAIEYYTRALEAGRQYKWGNLTDVLNKLSNAYLETGDIQRANDYAAQALDMANSHPDDSAEVSNVYTTMGKIFTAQKNYPQAISYLHQAIEMCRHFRRLNDEKQAWDAIRHTYDAMKQPAKAYDAYQHYIALRDSVYNVDKAKQMVRIDLESGFKTQQVADSLRQDAARREIMLRLQRQRAISVSGFAAFVLVLALSFFIYKNYSQQKRNNTIISLSNAAIQKEKLVSESLLLNILPEEVAAELIASGKVHAKAYDDVTVLFTDFVDFTKAGQQFSAQQLVAELDTCFQAFDNIIGKYNIEKIKTVGDGYLAVSGLPKPNADHACDILRAAMEIRSYMADRQKQLGENTFAIRIGINSGSVVAGIVGAKKFAYDIWGDTVNTAARMEQNCEAGKINISQSTYELVKDKFTFECRGALEAKGKGMLNMYYLEAAT